jgi:hypothetical protein
LSDLTRDNLPLFSFLLHWLLRAPLIRDVGYEQAPNIEGQPSLLFWHAGLSPLLRALKGLGLSPQEEYGERGQSETHLLGHAEPAARLRGAFYRRRF